MTQFEAILRGLCVATLVYILGRVILEIAASRSVGPTLMDTAAETFALFTLLVGSALLLWSFAAARRVRVSVLSFVVLGAGLGASGAWLWARYEIPYPWDRDLWVEAGVGAALAAVTWGVAFGRVRAVRFSFTDTGEDANSE